MTVKKDLMELVEKVAQHHDLPAVSQVYLPEPTPAPDKHTEFGVVALDDDSAGLYYAWLGESQYGMQERFSLDALIGQSPMKLVEYFESEHEADCSLGLAAINAITQSVFKQNAYVPDTAVNSIGALDIAIDDHLGMVGYFPALVKNLREKQIRLTVIEKKSQFAEKNNLIEVTNETGKLRCCNKVIITASTLLNDSIDEVLGYTSNAETIVVLGPTAGFFPEPLFERGVSAVGGSGIGNPRLAIKQLKAGLGLGDTSYKYLISSKKYPGIRRFLG